MVIFVCFTLSLVKVSFKNRLLLTIHSFVLPVFADYTGSG